MKKIVLVGASGTIGSKIQSVFEGEPYEIIPVRNRGEGLTVDMSRSESIVGLYERIGKFDALISAAGLLSLAPLAELSKTHWEVSISGKLMGQIYLAQMAIPYLNDSGSVTLISGVDAISAGGVAASVVNRGIEAYAKSAATEMPRGIRINVVSPGLLKESEELFRPYFPGGKTVSGIDVAKAFKRSVMGVKSGFVDRIGS